MGVKGLIALSQLLQLFLIPCRLFLTDSTHVVKPRRYSQQNGGNPNKLQNGQCYNLQKLMKKIALLAVSLMCLTGLATVASAGPKANPYQAILSQVAAAELPAKAATLVKEAKASEQKTTTINVVKAAVAMNSAAAPSVVGAISRAVPSMASVAASTAAAAQPKQASVIAMAAASAAPSEIRSIVSAVCSAVPSEYANVANTLGQMAPASTRDILSGIADAFPVLKSGIESALASNDNKVPTVASVIPQLVSNPRGPTVGPPYIPLSGTPANVNPGDSGTVPPGGRGYAAP